MMNLRSRNRLLPFTPPVVKTSPPSSNNSNTHVLPTTTTIISNKSSSSSSSPLSILLVPTKVRIHIWKWILRCSMIFFFVCGMISAPIFLLQAISILKHPHESSSSSSKSTKSSLLYHLFQQIQTTTTTMPFTNNDDTKHILFDDAVPVLSSSVSSSSSSSQNHRSVTSTASATIIDDTITKQLQHGDGGGGHEGRTPDGYFNGGPIYKQRKRLSEIASYVHCVGETHTSETTSWMDRSCHFQFLCYNTSSYDYILFETESSKRLSQAYGQTPFAYLSTNLHRYDSSNHQNDTDTTDNSSASSSLLSNSVSLGGINLKWGRTGIPRLQWFPKILHLPSSDSEMAQQHELIYYEVSHNTVMIPYHSLNGANPGHLVWDDFLPIYTLLGMFQLLDTHSDDVNGDRDRQTKYELLPIRQVLQDGERGLWASCDYRIEKTEACQQMITKFWSLLTGHNHTYVHTTNVQPIFQENVPHTSRLVCSQHGVAGMGSLTDHGLHKGHGWEQSDYKIIQNHGRGEQLYNFRNFMLRNMGFNPFYVPPPPPPQQHAQAESPTKYRIVFSQKSSDIYARSMDFEQQIQLVQEHFPNVQVEHYIMKDLSLIEQLNVTTRTSIYITLCGGGAVSAMFLPKGSSVLLYYAEDGGTNNGRRNYKPALLDFDLFNAMSYLRVHWLPRNTMKTQNDQEALVLLIEQELQLMQSQVFM